MLTAEPTDDRRQSVNLSDPSTTDAAVDYSDYSLRPIVFDAADAHRERLVEYDVDGTVTCRHPSVARTGAPEMRIPTSRQYPAIRASFDDLNKALSRLSNSPVMEGSQTLRQLYEVEAARYEELAASAYAADQWEPDYGSYVLDHSQGNLYLIPPERWHRLALVTSNAKLLTDPAGELSWHQVRERLENAVVGFAGVSVGGNLIEGWLREARPRQIKIADPDWLESTNLNRCERASIRHTVASRATRFDAKNPYETPRVSKAEYIAYEEQLVDPYARFFVYKDGLTRGNMERFLMGDGRDEPPIDILVEEMDNLDLKVLVREQCRERRIDVLMLSDFGHCVHALWNQFRAKPGSPLGYGAPDDVLLAALAKARKGDRNDMFSFITSLCGTDFASDQFKAWVDGKGEQPTSSLPQSGATAMASGAIGGKEIALHVLGYHADGPMRIVYDFLHRSSVCG
jgi:hypothetical protein